MTPPKQVWGFRSLLLFPSVFANNTSRGIYRLPSSKQQRSNRRMKMAKTILTERHLIEDIKSTMNALSQCPIDSTVLMWGEATRGGFAFGGILYLLFFAGALVAVSDSEYRVSPEVAQRADKMFGVFCEDKRQKISGKQFLAAWGRQ